MNRSLLSYAVLLLALLAVNPLQAANRKARPAAKARAASPAQPSRQDEFQNRIEQQIAGIKEDLYTRATWKKLQEVKQQADDTASNLKLVTFGAAALGFVLGCLVTFFALKRSAAAEDNLKIT